MKKDQAIRDAFKIGDFVVGIGPHRGCSNVFEGNGGHYQPFSYLDDFDPAHFRLATEDEKSAAIADIQR